MRQDLRKEITLYPPADAPDQKPQKHSLLNARDLINHSGWSTTKRVDQFTSVDELLKTASAEDTDAEKARKALIAKPINQMTREELQSYAEEKFGTKLDKRLNLQKMIDRLTELATASGISLNFDQDPDEGVQAADIQEAATRNDRGTEEGVQEGDEEETKDDE